MMKLTWAETRKLNMKNRLVKLESQVEEEFAKLLDTLKVSYLREYQFSERIDARTGKKRQWRADFALMPQKIIFEIDGGIHIHGGHSTPYGILNDREKDIHATREGWRVVRIPTNWFECKLTHKRKAGMIAWENVIKIVQEIIDSTPSST